MPSNLKQIALLLIACLMLPAAQAVPQASNDSPTQRLTLQNCIETALKNHQSLQVSDAAIAMADAQYRQAMSAYWPRISVEANAQRADQDRTYSLEGDIKLPPALTGALAAIPGSPQISSLPINTEVKLYDRDILLSSVNLTYPIFTGGRINAIVEQAEKGVSIAEQGKRKTELEVIRDVKKYFYGAQFAIEMEKLAETTLERFKVLEDLTERLYQGGSLKVKKTDYLRTRTTTAMTRSMLEEAHYARQLAHEALANAMGLDWHNSISLASDEGISELPAELEPLVEAAQHFNPDIQQLRLALEASESKITEAKSGYFPVIGFQASAQSIQTDYNKGLTNAANRDGWTLGLGLKWTLFDGLETASKVSYAESLQRQLTSRQILLDQSMALQVKQEFLRLGAANRQIEATADAARFADENQKLHLRAYQQEMMETKDVIEAQIVDTFAQSALHRSRHALAMAMTSLEFLIGNNIQALKAP